MRTLTEYFVFWFLVFCASGVVFYVSDSRYGGGLRRWWYNMTHENPLSVEETRGFLYRRSFRTRLRAAVLLGITGSLIVVLKTEFRPVAELFLWVLAIPAVFVGFALAPFITRLWQGREKAIHALEQLEDGVDLKKGAQDVARRMKGHVIDLMRHEYKSSRPTPTPTSPAVHKVADPPQEPQDDPRELMRRFIDRDKREGTRT